MINTNCDVTENDVMVTSRCDDSNELQVVVVVVAVVVAVVAVVVVVVVDQIRRGERTTF